MKKPIVVTLWLASCFLAQTQCLPSIARASNPVSVDDEILSTDYTLRVLLNEQARASQPRTFLEYMGTFFSTTPDSPEVFAWRTYYILLLSPRSVPQMANQTCDGLLIPVEETFGRDSKIVHPEHRRQFIDAVKSFYLQGITEPNFTYASLYRTMILIDECKNSWQPEQSGQIQMTGSRRASYRNVVSNYRVAPTGEILLTLGLDYETRVQVTYGNWEDVRKVPLRHQ